jgi:hypothetical protein
VKNGDRFFLFNEKGGLIIARLSPPGYEEVSLRTWSDLSSRAAAVVQATPPGFEQSVL